MSFFRKLFTNKKGSEDSKQKQSTSEKPNSTSTEELSEITTEEYFNERYQEDTIDDSILDGTLKMIEGYFVANKINPIIEKPINHPKNLDQTIDDGFGFVLYCKAAEMDESFAAGVLAMAFNSFMIKNHGFKLYKDSKPEYPLRGMTLKYDYQGAKLSLYPIEYAAKVIRYEANFEDLYEKIKQNLENMPTSDDIFNKLMGSLDA